MNFKKIITASLVFATCLVSIAAAIRGTFASNITSNATNSVSENFDDTPILYENEGIQYNIYLNKEYRTTAAIKYVAGGSEKDVINVPSRILKDSSTITITAVYESGFANSTASQINLPDTITKIGKQAFLTCTNLTSFIIPYYVEIIDIATFMNCTALTDISYMTEDGKPTKVNNKIVAINENAFTGCRVLASFTMPNNLEYIGKSAFKGCAFLTRVVLPSKSSSLVVDDYAFANCILMIMAYVPDNITKFGKYVFNNNNLMTIYMSRSSNPTEKDGYESEWNKKYVNSVNKELIPVKLNYGRVDATPTSDYIYSISTQPIYDNMGVHVLDENKTSANYNGEYAILVSYLDSVNSSGVLDVPNVVTDVEGNSYPVKVIEEGCYSANDTNKVGTLLKTVNIPQNIVKIGRKAFFDSVNLTTINFSEDGNLKEISTDAFKSQSKNNALTSLTFPASLEIIDGWAFENFYKLSNITFLSDGNGKYNLKAIGNSAFNCLGLDSSASFILVLPSSLDDSYYGENINSINYNTKNAYGFYGNGAIETYAFSNSATIKAVYMNESDEGVKSVSIARNAFYTNNYRNPKLVNVILNSSKLYKIGAEAFKGNWTLRTVYLNTSYVKNNNYTSAWGNSLFGKCAIVSVYLSEYYPKKDTSNEPPYNSWDLDAEGTDLSENDYTSSKIRRMTIPSYINVGKCTISNNNFEIGKLEYNSDCYYLIYDDYAVVTNGPENGDFTIPSKIQGKNVTKIGPSSFGGYRKSKNIFYDANCNITEIGDYAFWRRAKNTNETTYIISTFDSSKSNSCNIPSTVTYVGNYAFTNNQFLNVSIPSSVIYIGTNAFGSNISSSLSSVIVDSNNNYFIVENDNLYSKDFKMLLYHAKSSQNNAVVVNSNTKIIGFEAFNGASITSLDLNNAVESINGLAFNHCEKLGSVVNTAFLKYINYSGNSNLTTDSSHYGQSAYDGKLNKPLYYGAFQNSTSLKSFDLKSASSLIGIGENAFKGCRNLNNFGSTISFYSKNNTTLSGDKITSVLDLRCGDKLTAIGEKAFSNVGFTSIILPNSITEIGSLAFESISLKTIYLEWTVKNDKSFKSGTAFNYNSSSVHNKVYYVSSFDDVDQNNSSINYWTYYKNADGSIDKSKIVTFGTDIQAVKNYFA